MSENPHVTILVNDDEVTGSSTEAKNRGRSRGRRRSGSRSRSSSRSRARRDTESARRDATPLLPESALPRQKPPREGPEIDDDEDEPDRENRTPNHGIDDGFFDDRSDPDGPPRGEKIPLPEIPRTNGQTPSRRGSIPAVFPYAPPDYGGPGIVIAGEPRIIPDINVYQHKKTLAQGMMDLALLSANANQLRYVLESYDRHPYYYFSVTFIVASLVFQVLVGIGLVLNSRYNVKNEDDICKANKINDMITIAILLITIINVFVSAFGVAEIRS